MKLSTKGRYAVTAMMDLAIHDRIGPVTLADISQCQGISLSYLEQLFAKLRKHGLVEGVRGAEVVGAWRWLEDLGLGVAIEIEASEAYAPPGYLRTACGVVFGALVLAAAAPIL